MDVGTGETCTQARIDGGLLGWLEARAARVTGLRLRWCVAPEYDCEGTFAALGRHMTRLRNLELMLADASVGLPTVTALLRDGFPCLERLCVELSFRPTHGARGVGADFWVALCRLHTARVVMQRPDDVGDADACHRSVRGWGGGGAQNGRPGHWRTPWHNAAAPAGAFYSWTSDTVASRTPASST
jgi:hypothetical protein